MLEASSNKTRSWLIRIIALLLILQAVELVGVNIYYISTQIGEDINFAIVLESLQNIDTLLPEQAGAAQAFLSAVLLMPLAIPAMLAAIGFLFLFRFGWLLAMVTQVVTLLVCLMLYVEFEPFVIYPTMAYCIIMVLYLNVHEVRLAFLSRPAVQKQS